MADISVALELDDKQYLNALKRAGAEGDKFAKNTEQNVEKTSKAFDGLGKVIAGIGFGALITQSINLGKQLDSISKATGVAIRNVKGLQDAFVAAGGSADKASDGLTDLVKNIGDAAANGGELATAFRTVGVSLTDLATLSEADILRKVLDGLAKIPDAATRSAVGMKIMGEAIKGVDLTAVNNSYDQYSEKAKKIEESARNAAEAQKALTALLGATQTGIMSGLSPITELAGGLNRLTDQVEILAKSLTQIGMLLATVFVVTKAVSGIDSLVRVMSAASSTGKGFVRTLAGMGGSAGELGTGLRYLGQAFNLSSAAFVKANTGIGILRLTVTSLTSGFVRLLPIIGNVAAVLMAVNTVFELMTGKSALTWIDEQIKGIDFLAASYEKLKRAMGFGDVDTGDDGSYARKEEARAKATQQTTEENKRLLGVLTKQREELDKSIGAYQNQIKSIQDKINFEREMIGLTEDQKEAKVAMFEAEKAYLSEIAALQEKLNSADTTPEEKEEIAKAIQKITEAYEGQLAVLPELVKAKQAEESAARKSNELLQERLRIEEQIRRVQDEMATMTMSEIEKKEYDIKRAAEERARAYIAAEEARTGIKMSDQQQRKIINEYIDGTKELVDQTKKSYDMSRTWATGWKQAMNDYVKSATNGAEKARAVFSKAMSGMEDLLVDFAKTGKFQWKNFVAMMLEELLRAQIQAVFAGMIGDMTGAMKNSSGGSGGLLSGLTGGSQGGILDTILGGIGNILGGGSSNGVMGPTPDGGNIAGGGILDTIKGALGGLFGGKDNSSVMGGGSGGYGQPNMPSQGGFWDSITSGASSMWDSVSNVASNVWDSVSNIGSSISSGLSGIWDTVSNIGSSIGSLFGGFFAEGGHLQAGKWGIVGEEGPEIIHGPANITPMDKLSTGSGSGSTNVVYNINAVDARSFKQLLAQDPTYLYGLTMQGAKSIAGRR